MNTVFDPASLVREDLKTLVPYNAPYYASVIKLDANENPYPFPAGIMERIYEEMNSLAFNRYPDPMAVKLRELLAVYTGVGPEGIMVGNGSDELILNIMLTYGTGAKFVVASPTFAMYGLQGRVAGAEMIDVPRLEDFQVDAAALKQAAAGPDVKLVFICTPNNPTGNTVPRDVTEDIIRSTGAIVVVDEAYGEFGGDSCIPLLKHYPNLIVLRTFSKAFGLAGLRVGYLLANPAIINDLLKVKQPFNLNVFSQTAARVVMENLQPFQERVQKILAEKDRFFVELSAVPGVEPFPSQANFILFRTPLPARVVYDGLLKRGLLLRSVEGPALERCLRVSVGTAEENKLFIEKLCEILTQASRV